MLDWRRVRGALSRRTPIKLVLENGFDGAISLGTNLNGAFCRRLDALLAIRPGKSNDAYAGAISLFRMRSFSE